MKSRIESGAAGERARLRRWAGVLFALWLAAMPAWQPVLSAVALGGAASLIATEAEARSRSSGGYSRPSSRTPSFSSRPSSSSRRPSTSGGYQRPSAPIFAPRQAPAQSGADRAMQRRGSLDALDIFRRGRTPDADSSAGRGGITLPQGPLVRGRTPSTQRYGSGVGRAEAPPQWSPPPYAQGGGGRFGAWDGLLLWYLLDTLNRPDHARAFHDNRDDPGLRAWRAEAEQRASNDPALRSKLDELDRQTAALQGQPAQPGRLPSDVAQSEREGSGMSGLLVTVLLIAGFAFITWRFFRRHRAASAAKGGTMGPIDTAGGIIRQKLEGKAYKPSFFRIGMTFPLDPTPFLMADGVTKVTPPRSEGANNLVSVAAVGRIDAGDVAMHRLYIAGTDGWFQLWLDEDGRPEECRWFQPIDEVHPAATEEWGFWLDEQEGMIGWPEFQTKDGQIYQRHWLPGERRVPPREWTETIEDARGSTTRKVSAMLYARNTAAAAPAPTAEYVLVSAIEADGAAYVEVAAGIDINPAALAIA